jgi:uncharacterized protein YndB with AHSA1/START domain
MSTTATDFIKKQQLLRVPLERAWRAIGDAQQFGRWFGAELDGPFTPGARLTGRIVPTTADPAVAKMQEPYAGKEMVLLVDRVEPMRLLSFRWHPGIVERSQWDTEPTTLVEFVLEAVPEGTLLTVTESGFDNIPLERRAKAFTENAEGWTHQMTLIAKYLGLA